MKKIAIIGAGWVGIGCARILTESGYAVDVYDRLNDIGGTWHPDNCYAGLAIHQPARGIEYFDFPLPKNIDEMARMTSAQVYHYLQDYCSAKNLYQHCHFNMEVEKIAYDSSSKQSTLTIKNIKDGKQMQKQYDYVINTNGFCDRTLPHFKDMENFSGKIVHSFEANETFIKEAIKADKKITIIGASKTAADFIINFHKLAYKVTWLYNKPYWFFSFEKLIKMTKNSHKKFSMLSPIKLLWALGTLIAHWQPQITYWLWRSTGLIYTFGDKHTDFRKFHTATVDQNQLKILNYYNQHYAVRGEIEKLNHDGILLKDGRQIKTDIIICCTGSAPKSFVALEVDGKPFNIEQVYDVYRLSVIPQIPNLIFTAYLFFAPGTVNGLSQGAWIKEYIEMAPDTAYLQEKAVKTSYPFFTINQLFDSSDCYLNQLSKKLSIFFREGNILRSEYNKWLFNEGFFGAKPKPLKFKK